MSIENCEGCNMPNCVCPVTNDDHLRQLQNYANGDEYQRSVEWSVDRIAELERQVAEQERLLIGVRRYLKPNDPEPGHMTIEGMNGPEICEWCAHVDVALAKAKKEEA